MTRRKRSLGRALGAALVLAAVVAGTAQSSPSGDARGEQAPLVALLLPENVTPRWEGQDRPRFIAALKKLAPKAQVTAVNALNDPAKQHAQAEAALARGAKVLVVAAIDQKAAGRIVELGRRQGVPTIAYDRLIRDVRLDYFVTFDGAAVGRAQGKWLVANTKRGDRIAVINGSPIDDNAHWFKRGYDAVLNPLFRKKQRIEVADQFVPGWEPTRAQSLFEAILTRTNNRVDGVLSANDGMAGGIIAALRAQNMAGKVPVTGQDASLEALQRIVLGTQGQSVFKDFRLQAPAAARIAAAIAKGQTPPARLFNGRVDNGKVKVRSILLPVESIDKRNITKLIRNGYITKRALCKGIPRGNPPC